MDKHPSWGWRFQTDPWFRTQVFLVLLLIGFTLCFIRKFCRWIECSEERRYSDSLSLGERDSISRRKRRRTRMVSFARKIDSRECDADMDNDDDQNNNENENHETNNEVPRIHEILFLGADFCFPLHKGDKLGESVLVRNIAKVHVYILDTYQNKKLSIPPDEARTLQWDKEGWVVLSNSFPRQSLDTPPLPPPPSNSTPPLLTVGKESTE